MKLVRKKNKIFDIKENFIVTGEKEDLIKFEKILQENGIKDDYFWNKVFRQVSTAIYINVIVTRENKIYYYDKQLYKIHGVFLFDVKAFL